MRRHRARWRWLLRESRGYQARGTFSVRPSSRTTLSSSSVTLTSTARTLWRSLAKEAIPTPQQFLPIALHQLLDLPNLRRPEVPARLKTDRAQPELRRPVIALDMNVRRLAPVAGIEESAIGPRPQDCRHGFTLTECSSRDETSTTRPNARGERRAKRVRSAALFGADPRDLTRLATGSAASNWGMSSRRSATRFDGARSAITAMEKRDRSC